MVTYIKTYFLPLGEYPVTKLQQLFKSRIKALANSSVFCIDRISVTMKVIGVLLIHGGGGNYCTYAYVE